MLKQTIITSARAIAVAGPSKSPLRLAPIDCQIAFHRSRQQQAFSASTIAGCTTRLVSFGRETNRTPPSTFKPYFRSRFDQYRHPLHGAQRANSSSATSHEPQTVVPRSVVPWLYGCSALVFGIVVIGGLTRLTESGLSITEWQPITGILPPMSAEDWQVEWEKYRVSPEGVLTNSNIDMSEFKSIFYMEWAHRIAGRLLGISFIVPAAYYTMRYRLPNNLKARFALLGLGIGFQGALGWYMVKSGLHEEIIENKAVPRVSQYRLAAHLSAALALYVVFISTALNISRQASPEVAAVLNSPSTKRFYRFAHLALGMVFLTAVSGAFVAGLDAGLVYNEFPTMGGRLVPPTDELLDTRYAKRDDHRDVWWRNMLENPVTAQFDHRVLAITTAATVLSLPFVARRMGLSPILKSTRRWAAFSAAAAIGQASLGITTLLYLVPVPLAALHQAGSVVLLTCLTVLGSTMRRTGTRNAVKIVKS